MVTEENNNSVSSKLSRDEKLENLIVNHAMIFMGMFEEGFSIIVEEITDMLAKGGATMAEEPAGNSSRSEGSPAMGVSKKVQEELPPEVRTHIGYVFSGIREEIAAQWQNDAGVFKRYVASPSFDKGIEIVEKYDFGRPKLTAQLTDEMLASYIFLLQSGDKEIGKMFKELSEWQGSLPMPPWSQ
jgi:hypothetical protein